MRPLQFSLGECATEGECASQWHYLYKSVHLLAYADDIGIIGRTMRDVAAAFSAIEWESAKMDLAVKEGKSKYILVSIGN